MPKKNAIGPTEAQAIATLVASVRQRGLTFYTGLFGPEEGHKNAEAFAQNFERALTKLVNGYLK